MIYKQNPVIRGHFKNAETQNLTLLSDFDLDVLNSIYYTTQQNLFNIHPLDFNNIKTKTKSFYISDIKRALKMKSNTYIEDISNSLTNLYNIQICFKNFIDPITGKKIKEHYSRIIQELKFIDDSKNEVIVVFSDLFIVNILRHTDKQSNKEIGNFTPVNIETTRSIKSKYGKRLYEHLLSFKGKGQKNYLVMNIEQLNKLYGTNYTALYRLKDITERAKKSIKDKFEFTYEVYKIDKKISFKFI